MNKYLIKNLYNNKSPIRSRIIIANVYKKFANFLDDLKKFKKFEKYFVTKEDSDKLVEEKKKNEEGIYEDDLEWWEPTGIIEEFYMATHPGNGGLTPLYAKCHMIEFIRRGNSYPACLAALYKCDENGKESGSMIGYECYEDTTISLGLEKIQNKGMKGWGKQYHCYGDIYYDINKLKLQTIKAYKDINENIKTDKKEK